MNHFPVIFVILGDFFISYVNKVGRQLAPPLRKAAVEFAAPRRS